MRHFVPARKGGDTRLEIYLLVYKRRYIIDYDSESAGAMKYESRFGALI